MSSMGVNVNECDVKNNYYLHHTSSHEEEGDGGWGMGEWVASEDRERYMGYGYAMQLYNGETRRQKIIIINLEKKTLHTPTQKEKSQHTQPGS